MKSIRPSLDTGPEHCMVRRCSWPGCEAEGCHRAPRSPRDLPRSPRDLDNCVWFCLDHIRAYNSSWNYYAGMTEAEVEADLRRDQVWQRPSWRMGGGSTGGGSMGGGRPFGSRIHDPMDILGDRLGSEPDAETNRARPPRTPYEQALAELDLAQPVTEAAVKMRYKTLVKMYHPDRNNGDKDAEERFKRINQAYRTVMDSFVS